MSNHTVIKNLKYLRAKKGWSQENAAKAAGISRSHYAMIESGKSRPGVDAAQSLGKCMGFNWQDFYTPEITNLLHTGDEKQ